jgi:phosphodiesterase/alkaline phosphatase D-like protein
VNPASQVTTSTFTANWAGVPEAAGYRLDVSTSSSFASFLSGYNNLNVGTSRSRVVSGLSAGRNYYYRVRAYNASGTSGHSGVQSVITVPAAPASNSATNITSSGFTAPWGSVTGASGYRLDVATNSSFTSFVPGYQDLDVGTGGTGTTRTRAVSGLNPSTTYYYRVRAYNDRGSSTSSTTRSVTTRAVIPAAPVLKTTAVGRTSFTLGWDAVPGATGYRLDVSTRSDFATRISGYSNLSLGNVTSRTVSGSAVKSNTTYHVRLRATNSAGTSPNSATLVVKTLP